MEQIAYKCGMCGMTVYFFPGFVITCKGWDRHVFAADKESENDVADAVR